MYLVDFTDRIRAPQQSKWLENEFKSPLIQGFR